MTQAVAQAWLVLRLGGHGLTLGAVTACTFAPLLFGGAWAGAVVDRIDRRDVLLATQTSFILISSSLGILTLLDVVRLWMVFVGAVLAGCVNAFDQPARQIFVLEIVGRERTANAVGLNEVVINASRVLGPAAGGVLLVLTGVAGCFLFNAATFVPPLLVLWHFRPIEKAPNRPRRPHQTREGLSYVLGQPVIRSALIMATASGMLFNLSVALPLVATQVFHLGGGGYGLMLSTFGVGALGGAILAATGSSWPSGRNVRILALLSGIAVILTAGAPDLGVALGGLFICGFCSIWFIARANALAQLRAAPEMRGRVMGVWTMALPGMNPVTAPLVGLVCDDIGPRQGFGLAGVALVIAAGLAWHALRDTAGGSAAVAIAGPQPL
jgi:MFS family permease